MNNLKKDHSASHSSHPNGPTLWEGLKGGYRLYFTVSTLLNSFSGCSKITISSHNDGCRPRFGTVWSGIISSSSFPTALVSYSSISIWSIDASAISKSSSEAISSSFAALFWRRGSWATISLDLAFFLLFSFWMKSEFSRHFFCCAQPYCSYCRSMELSFALELPKIMKECW
jgi:hypothetical protein